MLGIGFGELILIAGIALVVIGPEKFPEFAKICLRTFKDLRSYVEEAKEDLTKELKPVKEQVKDLSRYDAESYIDALTDTKKSKSDTYSYEDEYTYGNDLGKPHQGPDKTTQSGADSELPDSDKTASDASGQDAPACEKKTDDEEEWGIPEPLD